MQDSGYGYDKPVAAENITGGTLGYLTSTQPTKIFVDTYDDLRIHS
jgi:hypothetical protein